MSFKMENFLFSFVLFLVCINNMNAENEFKNNLSEKLGPILKSETRLLFRALVKAAEDFNNAVNIENIIPKEINDAMKAQVEDIKVKINDNDLDKLKEGIKLYGGEVLLEIKRSTNLLHSSDTKKLSLLNKLIDDYKKKVFEEIGKFMSNVQEEWTKLYVTIPEEEKKNHVEYTKINDRIENAIKMERYSEDKMDGRIIAIFEAMREITDFFDYTAWRKLLDQM